MTNEQFYILFLSFCLSSLLTFIIIIYLHPKLRNLHTIHEGPQQIHRGNIPRIGGLSVFLTFFFVSIIDLFYELQSKNFFYPLFLISFPIFLSGFLEDLTQQIKPKIRLISSFLSAVLFVSFYQIHIDDVGLNFINFFLKYELLAYFFTVLSIVFLSQAFNIIDGLNGLSLSICILCILALSIIAFTIDDFRNSYFGILIAMMLLGVLIFNFPYGKIFLGDGGAYLIGFLLATYIVIYVNDNKNISPFLICQILIYPSYEMLRSFTRRLFSKKGNIFKPDRKHLHSLLYQKNLRELNFNEISINCITGIQIIFLQAVNVTIAVCFYDRVDIIIISIIIFIMLYELLHYKLRSFTYKNQE